MKIVFSGDVNFSGFFSEKQDVDFLDTEILDFIHESDYSVLNIEGAISSATFQPKKGISLASSPDKVKILKKMGCNIFNLANNHIMDTGVDGLKDTLYSARTRDYCTFGAGLNLTDAAVPLMLKKNNVTVALIAVCHPEGPVASPLSAGILSDDQTTLILETIKSCKEKADWVILNYHGGEEFSFVPMPKRRQKFHEYIDSGVDAVIAHHPHVVQGYEVYSGKFIFYSLGNFIFDIPSHLDIQGTNESFLLKLNFTKDAISFDTLFTQIDLLNKRVVVQQSNTKFILYEKHEYSSLWEKDCMRMMRSLRQNIISGNVINREKSLLRILNRFPNFIQLTLKKIKFFIIVIDSFRSVNQKPKTVGYLNFIIHRTLNSFGKKI